MPTIEPPDFEWSTKPLFLDISSRMKCFVYKHQIEKIENEMRKFRRNRRHKFAPLWVWGKVIIEFD